MRGVVRAAVCDGGDIVCELDGRKEVVGLADGGLEGVARVPVAVAGVGARDHAARLAGELDARVFAEAETFRVLCDGTDAGQAPRLIEEAVAGLLQRLRRGERAVYAAKVAVNPAVIEIIRRKVGVNAFAVEQGFGRNNALGERRRRGDDLEGGACLLYTSRCV